MFSGLSIEIPFVNADWSGSSAERGMDWIVQLGSGLFTFFLSTFLAYRLLWQNRGQRNDQLNVAFLHPNCDARGGGERVLWMAIQYVQKAFPNADVTIYSACNGVRDSTIIENAEKVFDVKLERPVHFIRLWTAPLSEAKYYPRLTLLFQAFGTLIMGIEAALRYLPDIMIDTQGCAFAYSFFWLAKAHVIAYVHYPFVGSGLLEYPKVIEGHEGIVSAILRTLRTIKTNYYRAIGKLYSYCGESLSVAMANSRWTRDHMRKLWPKTSCQVVYPPCDLDNMQKFDIMREREPIILSLSQFRPEKNQKLQIEVIRGLIDTRPEWRGQVKLLLYGGCRNDSDRRRAKDLIKLATELDVADCVEVHMDVSHQEILSALSTAMIGIHTMQEEHFGIGIVEFMASGVITVAHNSGGPKMDIIRTDEEGYLCSSVGEYVETLEKIISMPESRRREIRENARASAIQRFSGPVFEAAFINSLSALKIPMKHRSVTSGKGKLF